MRLIIQTVWRRFPQGMVSCIVTCSTFERQRLEIPRHYNFLLPMLEKSNKKLAGLFGCPNLLGGSFGHCSLLDRLVIVVC